MHAHIGLLIWVWILGANALLLIISGMAGGSDQR
jgi:hypothetical protein